MNEELEMMELPKELQKQIEKKVAELKEAKKVRAIFPVLVYGIPDVDEKEYYVGYFQQPSLPAFSKYITASNKDQVTAMRQLAKDCFLEGDAELVNDDNMFLFGTMNQFTKVIEARNGRLVNLSKAGK